MTEEMKDLLTRQMEAAETPEQIDRALIDSMKSLVDCQCKTAERVKELRAEHARQHDRREGALLLWRVLGVIAASGGGALILKMLQTWGK